MSIFRLPDLGEGLPDAEVVEWHVKEGDHVKTDQLLVSMETAKAVVEVPSPFTGKITKLHGMPGDIIKTGDPLVEFAMEGEVSGKREASKEKSADSGTVAGTIEVGNTVIEEAATGVTPIRSTGQTVKAIPAVRALAQKLQVDLSKINPTGPNGQITLEDVKRAGEAPQKETAEQQTSTSQDFKIDALRGVRRAMANTMAQSHAEVVPVTLTDDADIHSWPHGTDITARVIRAIVRACEAEPGLNSHFDMKKLERKLFSSINIGMAIDSREGLFVPVIKQTETLSSKEIRKKIDYYKKAVRDRSIPQDDLKGSTIQLSNFGSLAGRYANPVIVPPTVAILGTGRIREEVVSINGSIAVHRMMPLSLTIDHRAVTGGEAARFLATVINDLQQLA